MLAYTFDWSLVTRPQFLAMLVDGSLRTLALAAASGLLSFALGAALAAARVSRPALLRLPAEGAVEVVRNVPALFWILFFYFVLPELLPQATGRALHGWSGYAFVAGVLGLSVDNGAYLSDILRNGIAKVSQGERDAAASCGLSPWQACRWVLCPQALRSMLPAIANRLIHNFKNTSLCVAIALPELTWATQQIESITFKGLEVTLVATVMYAAVSLSIAFGLSFVGRRRGAQGGASVTQGQGHVAG